MWKFLFFAGLIGLCVCDVSLNAPYAASGYRPSPASLALPGEYGAPPLPATSVQVSEETVQFAGQTVEVNSQRPHNAYLPPANQFEQLKSPRKSKNEAFLPKKQPPKPFRGQLNAGELYVVPQQSAQFRNPVFVESKSIFNARQQLPQFQQIRQFNSNPRFQQQQQQQVPNGVYGPPPPQQTYPYPPPSTPVHETVDEKPFESDDPEAEEADTTDPTVVAVSNANGQYYILGKDNTLQRVVYEAIQTEDDVNNNGFTARLRYSPVEPIRDPVYGYDDEGHLVRIFNKKK